MYTFLYIFYIIIYLQYMYIYIDIYSIYIYIYMHINPYYDCAHNTYHLILQLPQFVLLCFHFYLSVIITTWKKPGLLQYWQIEVKAQYLNWHFPLTNNIMYFILSWIQPNRFFLNSFLVKIINFFTSKSAKFM
jgi:hypothetical protein